ncbi:IscS subfamily cysteine desulfurase [Fredinandcohnia quinoae]|uniref:IscS subfamily cysteine desulfurase n=1 Tax=Fredinandcohnia quinoae TaxID=2918902 RepID=A0AAW5E2C9_9BACI|nr:IscS subfamily cysteine desulfurase [Fredinandcohnia sp. SECRCQ15]MCH1625709.1 IscS subfamily cysteine desulfurase [Fredinandcohnia sp. SECRCQ15]
MIYLDYAATTPIKREVLHVFNEVSMNYFGNPSSLHDIGSEAMKLLELCRKELADKMNGESDGIYFTSGGSESNILAIRSLVDAYKDKGHHLITTATEHSSVFHLFKQLESEGFSVTYLSVDEYGHIRLDELKKAINQRTILASIQHSNSEIGTIQPVEEIGRILNENGIIFHCDCVQTFGKVPINIKKYHIDSLSISSHKIYGPKGVGACYINPTLLWKAQLPDTTHENGFRPGTVNVPGIAAFTTAAQIIYSEMQENIKKYRALRNRMITLIQDLNLGIMVEGHGDEQLPHIVGLSIPGIQGQYVMLECNRYGIAISTGSACQVGQQKPSKTMMAIGKSTDEAKQLIRISFGDQTVESEIEKVVDVLHSIVKK